MSVNVPLGSVQCLRRLQRMTANTSMMMLVGDKGFSSLSDYEQTDRNPHVVFHGSLSFMINFHLLDLYVKELGMRRERCIAYMESTVVDIFIPPPFLSNLLHCLCHVSPLYLKHPNKLFFKPNKIYFEHLFTTLYLLFL